MSITSLFRHDHEPERKILLSDTFGGPLDPTERLDADAQLCTFLRSEPLHPFRLTVDTFGQEAVTDHILALTLALHDELDRCTYLTHREKRASRNMGTGIFINAAPRTTHANGDPFYVAALPHGIRVVATPLSALAPVRERVERLQILPNENNGLYSNAEQFRSSYTAILLHPSFARRFPLQEIDPDTIPKEDSRWKLSYVDRYGNLVTNVEDPHAQWSQLQTIAGAIGRVRLRVGQSSPREIALGNSLGTADPGQLIVYGNGNIDVVRKWHPEDRAQDKLDQSAYRLFGSPTVGDAITTVNPTNTKSFSTSVLPATVL